MIAWTSFGSMLAVTDTELEGTAVGFVHVRVWYLSWFVVVDPTAKPVKSYATLHWVVIGVEAVLNG